MDGTILVADDDRTIRTVLTQALTRAGCKVHATSSLMTLMRWVEEGKGDLVISDVVMPDGNGLEALPRISPSITHQPRIAPAVATKVLISATAAPAVASRLEPALKPNQPTHSIAAPTMVSVIECGAMLSLP